MLNLLDGWFQIDLGEAAFYSVFGLLFVVVGIVFLVLVFTLLGFIMKKVGNRKKTVKPKKNADKASENTEITANHTEGGLTPELIAVITAAVAAQLESENATCDFIVRRITKL